MKSSIKEKDVSKPTEEQGTTALSMTSGVIWKQILSFCVPIMIGALFQQLYNTVDAVVVGQFAGKEALASVGGSASQLMSFVYTFFLGLATGGTVIIAQYFGAEEPEKVDDALHTAYTFAVTGGIALGIMGIIFTRRLLKLLDTPDELFEISAVYLQVLLAGLVFSLVFNIGSGILRAVGDSKRPLYILVVCCVVNIVLDLILVMGFRLGAFGAAIATVFSQAVSAGLITYLMMKKTSGLTLSLTRLHINFRTLGKILKIGFPTAIAGCMFSVCNIILQASINRMGIDEVAAFTAYGKIESIWWMVNQAFSTSVQTFAAQNFGAGNAERIRKGTRTVLLMDGLVSVIMVFALVFGCPVLLRLFTTDRDVIAIGIRVMRIIVPFLPVYVIFDILSATLRAEGDVLIGTLANLIGVCAFRIIWLIFVFPNGTIDQVVSNYPISWMLIASILLIYYLIRQPRILESRCGSGWKC